jgi:glyoxylase-like metal-dependent hydrolase (beta-lactamase superfamily II)
VRIETIDLEFQDTPHAIAAYLVVGPEAPVLVETGPSSTLPTLLARLAELGVRPEEVRDVLVTHIHLDHAGAAGWWASQGARVHVHSLGAPHLIDPSKLLASASRIYGDKMDTMWGEIVPAPADRVVAVNEGEAIRAGGLTFTALDTPGHARHHHVYRIGDIAFTGDAAGIRLPESRWIDLPAPPPEFDLEAWKSTLVRLRREGFSVIYPTHFGPTSAVNEQLDGLEVLLEGAVAVVRGLMEEDLDRPTMVDRFRDWIRARAAEIGIDRELIDTYEVPNPRDMSVDGIVRYWRRRLE